MQQDYTYAVARIRFRETKLLSDADDERPVLLCEYAYQILSSGGGFGYFRKLTETYPRFQGGFVWDFQDKALWQTDENGNRFPEAHLSGRMGTPPMRDSRFLVF